MTDHPPTAALRAVVFPFAVLLAGPAHAQGIGLAQLREHMDWGTSSLVLVEQLELAVGIEDTPVFLDAVGWYGGAVNRAWFRVEGEQLAGESDGEVEAHLYYGRLITPFWDFLVGVRGDQSWGDGGETRGHLAVGLTGELPLRIELEPTLFLSHEGDFSARLEAEYELLITQRIIAEPELELNLAIGDAPEWGVETGLNDLELALRVRYVVVQQFGPYVGVRWEQRFGDTADLARRNGEAASGVGLIAGTRFWF